VVFYSYRHKKPGLSSRCNSPSALRYGSISAHGIYFIYLVAIKQDIHGDANDEGVSAASGKMLRVLAWFHGSA
jgi:hypothetical protein